MSAAKQNPAWDHATQLSGKKGAVRCNYCREKMTEIRQLKQHLAADKDSMAPAHAARVLTNDCADSRYIRHIARLVIEDEEADRNLLLSLSDGDTDSDYVLYLAEIMWMEEAQQFPQNMGDIKDDRNFILDQVVDGPNADEEAAGDSDGDGSDGANY
ncbi:putative Zinc finger, BED-type [Corchorus olitorius]|uniref:Zinc finger, BED-type n=1 Tax=Corchorus olitorius TaxID=93759 RepID=A0A1R3G187_9ROSI|nr:putative Zinc finger, BED-type [Corchorus olitorius]